ncbi:MAG: sulfotransferase, partial [Caulobacteraceae bacterium]
MTDPSPTAETELAEIKAAARSDRGRAIDLAIEALRRGSEHPLVVRLVAEGLAEDRRWQDAAALLHSATLTSPDDADILTDFGAMLVRLGRPDEAMAAFDKALAIAPDSYMAHLGAGSARLNLNQVAAARDHYRRALEIRPGAAEPLSALAVIAVREDDTAEARTLAERALAARPNLVRAQTAIAQADMIEGSPAAAEARLNWVLGRGDLDDEQRADALNFLADALDAQDRPAEAFGVYGARNGIVQRLHARTMQTTVAERRIDEARRLTAWFEAAPAAPWRQPAGEDRPGRSSVAGHVFLTGFPRSGTTLLETVLASHPSVVAMEESAVLTAVGGPFLADYEGLRRLEALDAVEADACRDAYWQGVEALFPEGIAGRVLVDKLALHTPALPVIAKLFPGAKILFARRDPRDVVLSCFRRQFRMNPATYE